MFGLAGAHRSGKTTLARILAERLGIEFLETKVGDVFAELGLDPKQDLPFEKRLEVQNAILRHLEVQYDLRQGKMFVADRTPFDVLGYTWSDIRRDSVGPDLEDRVTAHIQQAAKIINKSFFGVMLLRPLVNPPESSTSAQACQFYMDHVYTMVKAQIEVIGPMIRGFISVESPSYDLDERTKDGLQFFGALKEQIAPEPKIWTP